MKRFGLIGHPIGHSLSPALFRAGYGLGNKSNRYSDGKHGGKTAANRDYAYDLIEGADFEDSYQRFLDGYDGINVTAPFKELAFARADARSPECEKIGAANLLVKTPEGIKAYNSDYLGVKEILSGLPSGTAAVIGYGGAGKAAFAAAEDSGFHTRIIRHGEVCNGVDADVIIYTLPKAVNGMERINCSFLLEANYKNPCMSWHKGYISGYRWLLMQAVTGYGLFTGETPDLNAMEKVFF